MSRDTSTADSLKTAAMSYFLKKGYACFSEIGVNSWGKLRADVLCLNLKCHIVLCEIKSSVQDYSTDTKWQNYLPYSNRMFFVFTAKVYAKLAERLKTDLRGTGIGVLVLNERTGYLDSKMRSADRKMVGKIKKSIVVRMAWRNGVSKRTNNRTRQFIDESESVDDF